MDEQQVIQKKSQVSSSSSMLGAAESPWSSLRIIRVLEALADNPRPHGCTKLEGASRLWRLRVGNYRVVYEIDDTARTVDVTIIRHRREAYRF